MNGKTVYSGNFRDRDGDMFFFDRTFSWIYWGVFISFVAVKAAMRPLVLGSDAPEFLQIFVLSYPNFCEAIIGSFLLVYGLNYITTRFVKDRYRLRPPVIILTGILLAAVYVITQELEIHNLGGQNVYDPYDVLFSVIGLLISYMLLAVLNSRRQGVPGA